MDQRFGELRVRFGPVGRADELSLNDFRMLSDSDADVLVARVDDFPLKAELRRMRGDRELKITDMSRAFKSGDIFRAVSIGSDIAPYETAAALTGALGVASGIYLKAFVPWRHRMAPYSQLQFDRRNRFGSMLSKPGTGRTYVVWAFAGYAADKIRLWLRRS